MRNAAVRPREVARSRRSRPARPMLEGLEGRLLMYAATGDHFAFGSRITWSIVPDGTNLGGVSSNLNASLNQKLGPNAWQSALQDAFAQWEAVANVNFVQVGDTGAPTGSGNYQQGSPSFGDIRIGGYAQANNILAYTLLPPSNNGGSDSGDIFFNSAIAWNSGSYFDLETVALHEVGHALGLDHSTDVNAAMFPFYNGVQQQPDQDDVSGVQSVWGPRAEDGIAAGTSNFNSSRAADITKFTNGSNNQIVLPGQDVASPTESYWFKFTTPANASSTLSVQVQSTYLSELSPRVQLYNAGLRGLVQASASPTSYGATVSVSIGNAAPNAVYYVKVLGSNPGETGDGAYGLTVNMGNAPTGLVAPPTTTVYAQPDQGGGGTYDRSGPHHVPHTKKEIEQQGDFLLISPNPSTTADPGDPDQGGDQDDDDTIPGVTAKPTPAATGPTAAGLDAAVSNLLDWLGQVAPAANLPSILIDVPHPSYLSGPWSGPNSSS